jgi:Tfp pilus assembly protein PilF
LRNWREKKLSTEKMADFVLRQLAKHFVSVRSGLSMKRGAQALVRGDGLEAVNYFKEAVSAKTEILKSSRNATVAHAMVQLASAYKLSGDEATATQTMTEAIDILQEKSPSDPDMYLYMNNLGVLLRNSGQVKVPQISFD